MSNPDLIYRTLYRILSVQACPELRRRACPELRRRSDIPLISTLSPDDWRILVTTAQREGVAPLLYVQLKDRDTGDIPSVLLRSLQGQYFASLARNALIYHELGAILELFRSEGFQTILLKGAALAGTVYPNIALRPMSDVDLLIRVPDLPRVQELLITQGYAFFPDHARDFDWRFGRAKMFTRQASIHPSLPGRGWGRVDSHKWARFSVNSAHFDLRSPIPTPTLPLAGGGGEQLPRQIPYPLSIDLHWRLLKWPRGKQAILLTEWLWDSALERTVVDIPALVLSQEAQILHLTSHLAKHRWGRLLWFYDVAQVVRCYEDELDWDLILAKAREFEILKALQVTLARTVEMLAPPLPSGVLERVESARPSLRGKAAFTLLTARDKHAAILLSVISRDSLLRKARYLATVAFPSAEYMIERYQLSDRRKLPLYYAYRLVSWFYLLLRSLLSVLCHVLIRQGR